MHSDNQLIRYAERIIRLAVLAIVVTVVLFVYMILWISEANNPAPTKIIVAHKPKQNLWHAPDMSIMKDNNQRKEIQYGKELIAHTARYLGPDGTVNQISNGMNCQNCHLDAGTKPFGNNYAAVAATYPKFRARSGTVESVEKRVNDCFERSLNGSALDTSSHELKAIVSYIQFIGSEVDASALPTGAGMEKISVLNRAADPVKGKQLYEAQCTACHGNNGEGMKQTDGLEYQFPPLWGEHSYNNGAGLYRLSNFAQFIHANMPLGATFEQPLLSEEDAWDIAAYVNSLPRPEKDLSTDWPKLETKPFDHPFGPFADSFPEHQHKYGPFSDIQKFYSKYSKK